MTHNIPDYQKYLKQVEPFYVMNPLTAYHTFAHHIERMIQQYLLERVSFLQNYPDLNEEDLIKAICFHDIVFTPGDSDNERLSADVFLHHYPGEQIVADAIISTEVSNTEYKNSLEMILHDLDWMGFSSYEQMKANEDLIFIEARNATNCCYEKFLIASISFYILITRKPFPLGEG